MVGDWKIRGLLIGGSAMLLATGCINDETLAADVVRQEPVTRPWVVPPRVVPQQTMAGPETGLPDGLPERADLLELIRRREPSVLDAVEEMMHEAGGLFLLLDVYREVAQERPVDMRPRLSWLLARLGRLDEAVAVATQAVEASPTQADAWFALGFAWGQHPSTVPGAVDRAVEAYRQVLALEPDYRGPAGTDAARLRRDIRAATPE